MFWFLFRCDALPVAQVSLLDLVVYQLRLFRSLLLDERVVEMPVEITPGVGHFNLIWRYK